MTSFGTSVRDTRLQARISQQRLAERAGITQSYLSKLESGERLGSPETINALADALALPGHVRALASLEGVAQQLGVSVAELLEDALKARAELHADPTQHSVISSMGVEVTRECSDACCGCVA